MGFVCLQVSKVTKCSNPMTLYSLRCCCTPQVYGITLSPFREVHGEAGLSLSSGLSVRHDNNGSLVENSLYEDLSNIWYMCLINSTSCRNHMIIITDHISDTNLKLSMIWVKL